jgi:senataxin
MKKDIESEKKMVGKMKNEAENKFMKDANVVFSTLCMAGGEKMKYLGGKIDYLIVDEACQCIEPSNLIPFCLNPKRVILVGD